ncbi:hypothetical protein [Brevundimonas sp.]|jgi:hypothetical protein|uniref:hypothetical protein n=1 Tax=Brevundimonas sp. TaxID=1871086 RepID=UPI002E0F25B9|nr:hypothetical protein [Brevundimonas sp.]
MRMLMTVVGATGAILVTAGAASAQSGAPPSPQQAAGGPIGRMTAGEQTWRFESEEMRRARLGSPEELEGEYGAERMDLARRVSDLIDQGKCREARELASEAGERSMVIRIRQTCRQRG